MYPITPSKVGDQNDGISALDASLILQGAVGKVELTPEQLLACDVTGNGTCSSLDAAHILQHMVGKRDRFDAGLACDSDWLFVPNPQPVGGVTMEVQQPTLIGGVCYPGSVTYTYNINTREILGQDFTGILLGDVTGNWKPNPTPTAVVVSRSGGCQVQHPLLSYQDVWIWALPVLLLCRWAMKRLIPCA